MPPLPFIVTIIVLLALAALGVAAGVSAPAPYGIIRESWRQTLDVFRYRSLLPLFAFALFFVQIAAPLAINLYPPENQWVAAAFLVLAQALVTYALAHVAYRLHRGLIYGEWAAGLSFGARERRMALYVLASWFFVTILSHLPIPAPPLIAPAVAPILGAALWLQAFVVKVLFALIGPAASLDDPKPLRRSIASVWREPAAIFAIVVIVQLTLTFLNAVFSLATGASLGLAILRGGITLLATTFFYILSEFALVIVLTRVWEDQYEPETRYAAHNLNWL